MRGLLSRWRERVLGTSTPRASCRADAPRPLRWGVLAVVVVLLALVSGCGATGTGDKGYVAGSGVTEYPVSERKTVAAVTGETLQGKKVSLQQLADGRPAVVNVWAYWCGPCQAEADELNAAAKQLGDKAAFLGISIRNSTKDNSLAFERAYDVSYPSLWDPDGQSLLAFPPGTAAPAIPSTVVLDSKGRVAASINGPLPSVRTLVELVESADK